MTTAAPPYRWRLRGLGLEESRRPFDVSWIDGRGLSFGVDSEWMVQAVRELHGRPWLIPPVGPSFTVDAEDFRSAYWTVISLAYVADLSGEEPPPYPDTTPEGAVN